MRATVLRRRAIGCRASAHAMALMVVGAIGACPALAQGAAGPEAERSTLDTAPGSEPSPAPEGRPGLPPISVSLKLSSSVQFRTDLRDTPGDVLIGRSGLRVVFSGSPAEKLLLSASIGLEGNWYDFDDPSALIPGESDPFDDLYGLQLFVSPTWLIDDRWSITVGGFASVAGETDAEAGDAVTGGGFIGAGYAFSPEFRLTLGAGAATRLEDDTRLIPVISFAWQVSDTVSLESSGLSLRLTAELAPNFDFSLFGGFESREFRLDDSRAALPEGVVRDQQAPIGAELIWRPIEKLSIGLGGGAIIYQEIEILDSDGDKLNGIDTDPVGFVSLRVEYRF